MALSDKTQVRLIMCSCGIIIGLVLFTLIGIAAAMWKYVLS